MKHLIKQLSASGAEAVGYTLIGDRAFNITQKGSSIKGFLDGYEVYSVSEKNPRLKDAAVVFASILECAYKSSGTDKIRLYESEWRGTKESSISFLDEIVPNLNEGSVVIKSRPQKKRDTKLHPSPNFNIEDCISYDRLSNNLNVLKKKVSILMEDFEESLDVAAIFTRRKLKKTMWGAEAIQKMLDNLRSQFLCNKWNKTEENVKLVEKSIERLCVKLRRNLLQECPEEKKMISGILIPDIIRGYDVIKDSIIELVTLLAPLVAIDKTFTEKTSYPAKFFIADEIIDQAQTKFDDLVKFLCGTPLIESKVLDPLDFVRMQMLNEIKES